MSDPVTTIMLVDDHAVVRTGSRMLLESMDGFSVICEVDTGDAAAEHYGTSRPDLVVMDLNLPGISGLEATRRIIQIDPEAKILIFSIHDEPIYATRAFDAGASGYLAKSCNPHEILEAVRTIAFGGIYRFEGKPGAFAKSQQGLSGSMESLSPREFEVFQMLGKGYDAREIADTLNLTAKTVSNYLILIKEKLHLQSTVELVKVATQFLAANQTYP